MTLSQKTIAGIVVVMMAIVIGGCIAIALTSDIDDDDPLDVDIDGEDFATYYNPKGDENFTVLDVFMRRDGNFLQGFYYDSDRRQFVESAGLYGQSKEQWLETSADDDRILEPDMST